MEKVIEIKRRAQRCILNGDLDGAMAEYEKLVATGDRDPYYCVLLADLLFKKGMAAEAEQRYFEAVDGYERQSLYKNAIAVCKKMARLSIAELPVARRLGDLHRQDGLPAEAGLCFIQHAEMLIQVDRFEEARDSLVLACETSPELVRALERLGEVEVLAGNPEGAVRAWEDAATRHEKGGNAAEAKRWRNRAEQLRPSAAAAGPRAVEEPASDSGVALAPPEAGAPGLPAAGSPIEDVSRPETPVAEPEPAVDDALPGAPDPIGMDITHGAGPDASSGTEAPRLSVDFEMFDPARPGLDDTARVDAPVSPAGGPVPQDPFAAAAGTAPGWSPTPGVESPSRFPAAADAADGTAPESPGVWDFGIPRAPSAVDAVAGDDVGEGGDEGEPESPAWDAAAAAETAGESLSESADAAAAATATESAPEVEEATGAEVDPDASPVAVAEPAKPATTPSGVTSMMASALNAGAGPGQAESEEARLAEVAQLLKEAQVQFHNGDREAASIALVRAAQTYDQMERYDSAAAIYRSLGNSTDSSLQLMLLWMKNCQRRDDSLEAARVACDLGDRALNDGDRPGAREWFERARSYDPDNEIAVRRLRHFDSGGVEPREAAAPAPDAGEAGMLSIRTDREEPVIIDLGTLIEEFQRGAGAQLASDPQGHYDLAMSYREMGLFDPAIDSFRISARDPAFLLRSTEMIGRCLLEVGQFDEAAAELRAALAASDLPRDVAHDLRYQLGLALEAAGRAQEALAEFEQVYAAQANYPDVAMKIRVLRKSVEAH